MLKMKEFTPKTIRNNNFSKLSRYWTNIQALFGFLHTQWIIRKWSWENNSIHIQKNKILKINLTKEVLNFASECTYHSWNKWINKCLWIGRFDVDKILIYWKWHTESVQTPLKSKFVSFYKLIKWEIQGLQIIYIYILSRYIYVYLYKSIYI